MATAAVIGDGKPYHPQRLSESTSTFSIVAEVVAFSYDYILGKIYSMLFLSKNASRFISVSQKRPL